MTGATALVRWTSAPSAPASGTSRSRTSTGCTNLCTPARQLARSHTWLPTCGRLQHAISTIRSSTAMRPRVRRRRTPTSATSATRSLHRERRMAIPNHSTSTSGASATRAGAAAATLCRRSTPPCSAASRHGRRASATHRCGSSRSGPMVTISTGHGGSSSRSMQLGTASSLRPFHALLHFGQRKGVRCGGRTAVHCR